MADMTAADNESSLDADTGDVVTLTSVSAGLESCSADVSPLASKTDQRWTSEDIVKDLLHSCRSVQLRTMSGTLSIENITHSPIRADISTK